MCPAPPPAPPFPIRRRKHPTPSQASNLTPTQRTTTQDQTPNHHPHTPSKMSLKGPTPQQHEGSGLRIGIVHARWNSTVIEPLVAGAKAKLLECGVKESNITVQSCPGSWELPIAVQRCVSPLPFSCPSSAFAH